nr:3-coathanger stack domain-containing protein [uncultured Chryseobacterium sp.]
MKKIFSLAILLVLFSVNSLYSQAGSNGSDIIICLDNSASVENFEFNDMTVSTKKLIQSILSCNPNNKVSVVHYGTSFQSLPLSPKIYIESDFTNNLTTAQNFSRRLNDGDHFHQAVGMIGEAIDNIPSSGIVSPQKTLTTSPSRPLIIFLFTDGGRGSGNSLTGSYLVNLNPPNDLHENNAFLNFTNFKNHRNAKFVVVHVETYSVYKEAAASIASFGGSYPGPIEGYPADPDNNQVPRFYLNKNNFILSTAEISGLTENICSIGKGKITFYHEPLPCEYMHYPFNVNGSYTIPVGSTITNFQMALVNTSTGISYPTSSIPTYTSPNFFNFSIDLSNMTNPLAGEYKLQASLTYTNGSASTTIQANNGVLGFPYDVKFCCPDHLYIDTNVIAPNVDLQSADHTITAVNVISNGSQAVYHAGKFVLLNPGFNSEGGSDFYAYIEGCKPEQTVKPKDDSYYIDLNADPNNTKSIRKESIQSQRSLQIFPNPNTGIFTVSVDKIGTGSLQVSDVNGKTVFEKSFKNEKEIGVNIQSLPSATYIVKVFSDNEIITQKIIKR